MTTINYAAAEFLPVNVLFTALEVPADPRRRSALSSPVAAVWAIVQEELAFGSRRCQMQVKCEQAGINPATARTQIQKALMHARMGL